MTLHRVPVANCPPQVPAAALAWRALYVADDAMVDLDEHAEPLAEGTLLWSDDVEAMSWRLRTAGRAWWLTLEV